MITKLNFIVLACFFHRGSGILFRHPSIPVTPNNNLDSRCDPCQAEDATRYGAGNHGTLLAVAIGRAWKDGTEFKWCATALGKNTNSHIKGEYILLYGIPHTRVIVKLDRGV